MSIQDYNKDMVIATNSKEVSTHVHTGGTDYDYLMNLLENKTREYTFMTFDDFRISLGRDEWGKKVFFETMRYMKVLCKKPSGYRVKNPNKPNIEKDIDIGHASNTSYIPCVEGAEKYPGLFVYDQDSLIWGFNGKNLHLIDDEFIAKMREIADELKVMYREERRIQGLANYQKSKREKFIGE